MTIRCLAGALLALAFCAGPACAAEDQSIARMATCRDSWLEWNKTAPAQFKAFADHFRANFSQSPSGPFSVPKTDLSIAGLRVVQAFPENVGMGVGFSVTVDASFDKARKVMESTLGKRLAKCEASDGMHTCELDIAEQRTFTLMAEDGTTNRTLVGCYYYYEK
jgi:hypothetical protein